MKLKCAKCFEESVSWNASQCPACGACMTFLASLRNCWHEWTLFECGNCTRRFPLCYNECPFCCHTFPFLSISLKTTPLAVGRRLRAMPEIGRIAERFYVIMSAVILLGVIARISVNADMVLSTIAKMLAALAIIGFLVFWFVPGRVLQAVSSTTTMSVKVGILLNYGLAILLFDASNLWIRIGLIAGATLFTGVTAQYYLTKSFPAPGEFRVPQSEDSADLEALRSFQFRDVGEADDSLPE